MNILDLEDKLVLLPHMKVANKPVARENMLRTAHLLLSDRSAIREIDFADFSRYPAVPARTSPSPELTRATTRYIFSDNRKDQAESVVRRVALITW